MSEFPPHASDSRDPSFDEAEALAALGGDRELLAIVARAFVDEAPKILSRLRQAVADRNAKEVQSAGHALKGTVRYFGDTQVYDLAYLLETQGRSGNLDRAAEAVQQLDACVPSLAAELVQLLTKRSSIPTPPG